MTDPTIISKSNRTVSVDEYLMKEFEKLNMETEKLLEEIRSREKYSLTIIAIVSTWVYTEKISHGYDSLLLKLVGCIPFLIVCIYGFSVKYLYENIKWKGKYLRKIEDHFLNGFSDKFDNPFGWEKYFFTANRENKFVKITYSFWIIQVIMAFFLVILVLFYK
jgi:hypothetical protein